MKFCRSLVLIVLLLIAHAKAGDDGLKIRLATGHITTTQLRAVPPTAAGLEGKHALVQFEGPLADGANQRLAESGVSLLEYVPDYAYTVRLHVAVTKELMEEHGIRWLGPIRSEYKISPVITEAGIGDWARRGGDRVEFALALHPDEDVEQWTERFKRDFKAEIVGTVSELGIIELIVNEADYLDFAEIDAVMWIEPAMPEPEEHNNASRYNTGAETLQAPPFGLTGENVVVAEWDGGRADLSHPDLGFRRVKALDEAALSTHATHVAGTILGDGADSDGLYRGMAPAAHLLTQEWWNSSSELTQEYNIAINAHGATIATNSWGYGVGDPATQAACENTLGNYYLVDRTIDEVVRGLSGAPITICWSAGNQRSGASQYCGSIGWTYNTIGALGCAKNIITVGAIRSSDSSMTSFSSWGPTDDGRIKPDVVGPGYQLRSCKLSSGYTVMSGTSMSTPAVAGTIALLQEQWNNTIGSGTLLPSTIKGILINTAVDLGNPGPDFSYGHGMVNGVAAATKIAVGEPSYVQNEITQGASHVYDLTVLGSTDRVKVTLVWDDQPGIPNTDQKLVNDLDLILTDPFGLAMYPWILDPDLPREQATTGQDHRNNVETVEISDPAAGLWKAVVSGFNVPEGPQSYSLVISPDSLHTPGSFTALAALAGDDISGDPGTTVFAEFRVANLGAEFDSVSVNIVDDASWLQSTVDTSILLNPFDTAHFVLPLDIPAGALAGEEAILTCSIISLSNALVVDQTDLRVSAEAVYEVALTALADDTVKSPDSFVFDVTVTNLGNDTDEITVLVFDAMNWSFDPQNHTVSLAAGADTSVTYTVSVPAEVPHDSVNMVTLTANGSDGAVDSMGFDLTVSNLVFPPALVSPEPVVYGQQRIHGFEWTSDEATSFSLLIAIDPGMSDIVRSYAGITESQFTMPMEDSLSDGWYYWSVRRFLEDDSSSLQLTPHEIVVDNIAPIEVTPDVPGDSSYVSLSIPVFEFSQPGDEDPNTLSPELALVQVSQDSAFASNVVAYDSIGDFAYSSTDTLNDGRWYWRVQRFDLAGNYSAFSPHVTYLIDTEGPPVPTLRLPEDSSIVNADTVTIAWQTDDPATHEESPERYYLHVSNRADFGDFSTFQGYVYDTAKALPATMLELGTTYHWRVRAFDSAGFSSVYSGSMSFEYLTYTCGDLDQSGGAPDLGDLTYIIAYLFLNGPEPIPYESGSFNGDGIIDLGDLTTLISYLFLNGPDLDCSGS